jgi:hypothetical protein
VSDWAESPAGLFVVQCARRKEKRIKIRLGSGILDMKLLQGAEVIAAGAAGAAGLPCAFAADPAELTELFMEMLSGVSNGMRASKKLKENKKGRK